MSGQESRDERTPATRTGTGAGDEDVLAATTLGRYQILSLAGVGGMGRVYAAFDPHLDRRVAVKVVRRSDDALHQKRAAREAKALARVSHPNVVAIHDVSEHEGQLLIAMEFVTGRTLKSWMRQNPPSESKQWLLDALDILLQAGQGLVAAHEAKLVHRDFKPSNVLVGADGRVRVVDFGLARDVHRALSEEETGAGASSNSGEPITRTGAVMGTPAYMAPEQPTGRALDGRVDQYAFCVSAWEVLFGIRPESGVAERPDGSVVPAQVEKALRKGISKEPPRRHRSMASLLALLQTERELLLGERRRVSRWWMAAAAAVGGLAWAAMPSHVDPCADPGRELKGVWGPDESAALRAVFEGSGVPYAQDSWTRVDAAVDRYVTEWTEMASEACEASQHERPLPTTGGTVACLAQRRRVLASYLEVLTAGQPEALAKAVAGVEDLPAVSLCGEADFVLSGFETPTGAAAAEVVDVRETLAESAALRSTGQHRRAANLVSGLQSRVESIDFPPLSQDYAVERASVFSDSENFQRGEQLLLEAYAGATDSGRRGVALDAASRLAYRLARRGKIEASKRWLSLAEPQHASVLGDAQRALLLRRRGNVLDGIGNSAEAVAALTASFEIEERRLGADAPGLAEPLSDLAVALRSAGKYDAADAKLERALILARQLGDTHPAVAQVLHAQIGLFVALERGRDAIPLAEEALRIRQRTYGADHPIVAHALIDLGSVTMESGDSQGALTLFERADATLAAAGEDERIARTVALLWMGGALGRLGRRDEAAERVELAHSIRRSLLPESHPDIALSLNDLAFARTNQGRFEEALALYGEVRDLMVRNLGPNHPDLELPEGNIGTALMRLERYPEAMSILQDQLGRIESSLGKAHPRGARPLYNLGLCAEEMENFAEAALYHSASLASLESPGGEASPMQSFPLIGLARVALADGRPADAIAFAERALRLTEGDKLLTADARSQLAKAVWLTNRDRARARNLADAAIEAYLEEGTAADANRKELQDWREDHGL